MTRYYYGSIKVGYFNEGQLVPKFIPMAIINELRDIKEFDDPDDAWEHYRTNGFDSYLSEHAMTDQDQPIMIVFNKAL